MVCISFVLVLAVWVVFGQATHFDFVNFDDGPNVYANPVVKQGLSFKGAGWAFAHAQVCNWIPLTTLSHMLDCQFFGLRAGGHHFVNILFHAAAAVLLFLVLLQMTGSLWRSAFVAALFAVHPLRAESVAWVSERKDVLSAFFFVLAIGAYVRYVEKWKAESRRQRLFYALALVFFVMGLLAKSMVATLPFVLLLLDYWPLGRFHCWLEFLRLVREKIPLFAVAAASCVVTALVPGLIISDATRPPFLDCLGNAIVSHVVYLSQLVFPVGLATPYVKANFRLPTLTVLLALLLLVAISVLAIVCRKKRPSSSWAGFGIWACWFQSPAPSS